MVLRKIVRINEEKCNGCEACIPNCAEGALQIIDGKAKLISEKYCDGLGACLGKCPQEAITIEEIESEEFDKQLVEEHLKKMKPTSSTPIIKTSYEKHVDEPLTKTLKIDSALTHWPIQLMLVPSKPRFLDNVDLLIAADCVPFSYGNFHSDFLKGKSLIIGCPKLDNLEVYKEKLTSIFKQSNIRSVTVINMEVPCCYGLYQVIREVLTISGKNIPLKQEIISIKGKRLTVNS